MCVYPEYVVESTIHQEEDKTDGESAYQILLSSGEGVLW